MDLAALKEKFPEGVLETYLDKGQAVARVGAQKLLEVLSFCKSDPAWAMDLLLDVIGVDFMERDPRFEVVYVLYSTTLKHRLRLKVGVKLGQSLPSALQVYTSADWAEREVWDMFGISFQGHPNLKRILLFEGFEGHPLRKDYPVDRRQPIPQIEDVL